MEWMYFQELENVFNFMNYSTFPILQITFTHFDELIECVVVGITSI